MRLLFLLAFFLKFNLFCSAQDYLTITYDIQTVEDLVYGQAEDFAGNNRTLAMDISTPMNDPVPDCGRPVMVIVHGGAFLAGDKNQNYVRRMREDFAGRGYFTASVNYRLGMFHTEREIHCNVTSQDLTWDCLNMTDTSEWYRGYYRGIQDVNGAIRYLVQNAADWEIDPNNIFLAGESAGGFIVMGVGFIDHQDEILTDLTQLLPDAPAPNGIYEDLCITGFDLDTAITSMDLTRPDQGSVTGTLNPNLLPYRIRAVGNFFGGVFNNIFVDHFGEQPDLWLYHQPNDLIVPFGRGKVLAGFSNCLQGFPFNCGSIINRPIVFGSKGVRDMIEQAKADAFDVPEYEFIQTNNTADCLAQGVNPSLQGHAIDNFAFRTRQLAEFFVQRIEDCQTTSINYARPKKPNYIIAPNPISLEDKLTISGPFNTGDEILLIHPTGHILFRDKIKGHLDQYSWLLNQINMNSGVHYLSIYSRQGITTKKVIIE